MPEKPEMLTPSEIASLRAEAKETSAYFQKAFAHLRPKTARSESAPPVQPYQKRDES